MTTQPTDEMPQHKHYSIGDCQMLEHPNGAWVMRSSIRALIDWVTDHDDRDVMLEKLARMKDAL